MHSLAESGEHINQVITALSDRRMIPCRIGFPVHQRGVVFRGASDGIEHCAITAHFGDQLQSFNARHHLITTMCRIAGAGKHYVFHVERVTILINEVVITEKVHCLTALLALLQQNVVADIRGCMTMNKTCGAQQLFSPFITKLPQLTLPPVGTAHTRQRARYQIVINRVAAIMFAAQRFIGWRENIEA